MQATEADLRRVLGFAERSLAVADQDATVDVLLAGLAGLTGADAATLHETDVAAPRQLSVGWPRTRLTVDLAARFRPLLMEHPFRPLYSALRPGTAHPRRPFRITDLMTQREWRATAVAREVLPEVGDQLGVMLGRDGGAVANVVLTRNGGAFTDRERDLLGLAAAHVAAAAARARPHRPSALQTAPQARWLTTPGPLSDREREVLALVAAGLTDAQAAARLGLSPRTVARHLQRVYARLGVPNRAAAVALLPRLR